MKSGRCRKVSLMEMDVWKWFCSVPSKSDLFVQMAAYKRVRIRSLDFHFAM